MNQHIAANRKNIVSRLFPQRLPNEVSHSEFLEIIQKFEQNGDLEHISDRLRAIEEMDNARKQQQ